MSDDDLREIVRAAAEAALSQTLEVNGGELESVTTIYRPSGLAVLVADAVLAALPRYEQVGWLEGDSYFWPTIGVRGLKAVPVYRRLPTEGAQP